MSDAFHCRVSSTGVGSNQLSDPEIFCRESCLTCFVFKKVYQLNTHIVRFVVVCAKVFADKGIEDRCIVCRTSTNLIKTGFGFSIVFSESLV